MNMLLHWEYLIAGRPRDHKGWDGNGGIPAQHTPVNGSREIGRGVGYRKYSEQLSGYPTIQSAMEGGNRSKHFPFSRSRERLPLIEKEAYLPMITRAVPIAPIASLPVPFTNIPDVETDPKPFDRDRVAIADPFRDRNPVLGTPILVATAPKPCLQKWKLGVPISTQKSMISDTGAFEFAKRFCVKGGRVDLSAMSARCLLAYHHPYGLMAICKKYPFITKSELSLPYLRGFIISFLLKEMKPSDLKVAPDELFPTKRVRDFLEWSFLRNWMKDWLRYVHWYWSVANSPDVSLSYFFSASVYEKEWRIRRESRLCLPFVIFRSRLGKGRVDYLWELSRRSRWSCAVVLPNRSVGDAFVWYSKLFSYLYRFATVWLDTMRWQPQLGSMGMKVEGAGKKRLFPIGSPLYQALVRPIHDWAMTVLARFKMDGLFGNPFATSWTFILCSLVFQLPVYKGYRSSVVTFTKGQPLGFLSSWPLFTLTHHMLVWIAAVWHDEALRLCHSWRRIAVTGAGAGKRLFLKEGNRRDYLQLLLPAFELAADLD
ncbi:hypothetical protein FEM48_ZijujMtG0004900 (mitochondrion) [Ziziphus jujuba var. spinosa]|uniref:Uncharacterized protein n=1 Tax=Ziziphus jujuba var. spinosa TaxID=714518 RepID=A0A978UA88_ZIZJJ|nr:hypothetical protein FEM48_ZijujMtG0004900 [Ziziphus jujuba var. spinosa]